MSSIATRVHSIPGRTRLRIEDRRGDPTWFDALQSALSECPTVRDVRTNPGTGSVVVRHTGDWEQVRRFASDRELFESPEAASEQPPLASVYQRLRAIDLDLRSRTGNEWGIGAMAFYALVGASLYQLGRGKFLPAGATLLFQAVNIMLENSPEKRTDELAR